MKHFLLVLICVFAGNFHSARAETIEVQTSIKCADINSEIISSCTQTRAPYCTKQEWIIGERTIDLKKGQPKDFNVVEWACSPSKHGLKIVFLSVNWGNCDSCERFTIWEPTGNQLVGWKNFNETYRNWNFPKVTGEKFSKQFSQINLKNKSDK